MRCPYVIARSYRIASDGIRRLPASCSEFGNFDCPSRPAYPIDDDIGTCPPRCVLWDLGCPKRTIRQPQCVKASRSSGLRTSSRHASVSPGMSVATGTPRFSPTTAGTTCLSAAVINIFLGSPWSPRRGGTTLIKPIRAGDGILEVLEARRICETTVFEFRKAPFRPDSPHPGRAIVGALEYNVVAKDENCRLGYCADRGEHFCRPPSPSLVRDRLSPMAFRNLRDRPGDRPNTEGFNLHPHLSWS